MNQPKCESPGDFSGFYWEGTLKRFGRLIVSGIVGTVLGPSQWKPP